MRFQKCRNLSDFRPLAKARLPAPLFHYIDGGADDEVTLHQNTAAFDQVGLIPSGLTAVCVPDTTVEVLGQKISWPVFLSPTGMSRLFHHDGERAAARAARDAQTIYTLSTLSTVSIEEIGALTQAPKCFQIYIHKDRGLTREFIARCRNAGFTSVCLTIDTAVAGNRERDLRTGMVMPPKLTLLSFLSFLTHWDWSLNFLAREKFQLANVVTSTSAGSAKNLISVIDYINSQIDPSINWDDAAKLIKAWDGPFAIKGILSVEDAKRARDIGATAVMISNHGGRQLDGACAPFEMLGQIVDAVGEDMEVILDGGIRRGTHVLKALAMGACACMIGRGYLYALAAGGQPGISRALSLLRKEIERDMILMGAEKLSDLNRSKLLIR